MTNPDFNKLYGWQDIESAPRDEDEWFMVLGKYGVIPAIVRPCKDRNLWFTGEGVIDAATHWRPLPTTKEAEIMQIMWEGLEFIRDVQCDSVAATTLNKVRSKIDE